jgi:hypothetical protein
VKKKKKARIQNAWAKIAEFGKMMLDLQNNDNKEFLGIAIASLTEEDLRGLSAYFLQLADEKREETDE